MLSQRKYFASNCGEKAFTNTMRISKVVVVFSLIILSKADKSKINTRRKRANQDNFNILLNMYKLNPLQHSNVYKTFSNRVLLPRPDRLADLNLNSKESIKEKQYGINFKKQYGEILHYSTPNKIIKAPLNDLKSESFNSGHVDNYLIDYKKSNVDGDIFDNIFVPPKTAKNQIREDIIDDKANTIDLDENIYILKKKRKPKKTRYNQNAEVILA